MECGHCNNGIKGQIEQLCKWHNLQRMFWLGGWFVSKLCGGQHRWCICMLYQHNQWCIHCHCKCKQHNQLCVRHIQGQPYCELWFDIFLFIMPKCWHWLVIQQRNRLKSCNRMYCYYHTNNQWHTIIQLQCRSVNQDS